MSGGNAENTLHENSIGYGILCVVIAILIAVFWYYYDTEVRNMVRWIRYAEMWVLSWIIPVISSDFTVQFNGKDFNWLAGFDGAPKYKAEQLSYGHLAFFGALTMQPLKYVFAPLCFIGAYWCMFKGPGTNNRQKLTIQTLIKRQKVNFPVIAPFVDFNPSHLPARPPGSPVPAELPIFAEALGPEEWIAFYNIPVPDGKVDEEAAAAAFKKQLIGRWKGPKALPPHQQILLAAFCLKAARKRKEGDTFLGRIAQCWNGNNVFDLSADKSLLKDARKILGNKKLSGTVLSNMNHHAFVTTAMIKALKTARDEGGVLASAQFVWLRAYDRTLWYPLNNLGRQSVHMEALGAMSHYRMERITQRPVPIAKVEDAVESITEYMSSKRARPIPAVDYSNSKKSGIKKAKS